MKETLLTLKQLESNHTKVPSGQCDKMLKSKVAQKFPNVIQKVPTAVFTKKRCCCRSSPKVTKHLAYLCNENYAQEMQKNRPIWSHCKRLCHVKRFILPR